MTLDFIDILWMQDNQWPGWSHDLEYIAALLLVSILELEHENLPTLVKPSAINARAD